MVRSPAGSTSPGGDYALGELSQPAVDEASPGVRMLLMVREKDQLGTWGSASIMEQEPGEKPLPCFADFLLWYCFSVVDVQCCSRYVSSSMSVMIRCLDQRLCRGISGMARQSSVCAWEMARQGRERVKAYAWSRCSE